ncbi:S1C family serine protease [Jutongia sp.]
MEEKNQNTNEYTGEYGNPVERNDAAGQEPEKEQESSVYSYSYRDHKPEATSSGDYHASDNTADASEKQDSVESNAADSGYTHADNAQSQSADPSNGQQSEGWTAMGAQQERSDGPSQTAYQERGGDPSQTAYRANDNVTGSTPEKKKFFNGKKLAACTGLAVVFGIVAAVCFQGVCYFSSKVLGVNLTGGQQIAYTTDNVKYTNTTGAAIGTADVSGIAQQTMPSIVSITSTTEGEGSYDLFGQYYQGQDEVSAGTGFIVGKNDKELLIATNNHVVDGAKAISVQFIDEEVYDATTKGNDSSADLAVIAVKLKDMKKSTLNSIRISALGDSSESKVGEMVVAIGNALGYGQSVTVGYVSAKDREITEQSEDGSSQSSKMKVIQTDAAINPGNSGGPLLNMKGEVIGINSSKIAASSVEGVGYSIPISEATPIIDELMNREVLTDAQKGYLGISGKTVSEEASNYNMPEGVYVSEVAKDGAAGKAGIKQGDIITAINDIQVTTIESLKEKANSYKKGTKVTITLKRSDNGSYVEKKVEVTLQGSSSLNSLQSGSSDDQNSNNNSGNNSGNGSGNNDGSQDGSDSNDGESGNGSSGGWGSLFPGFGN